MNDCYNSRLSVRIYLEQRARERAALQRTPAVLADDDDEKLGRYVLIHQITHLSMHAQAAKEQAAREQAAKERRDQRTMLRVDETFRFISRLMPKRVSDEEIGDALELIAEQLQRSTTCWPVCWIVATTLFWLVVNTARYLVSTWSPKASGGR